MNMHSLTGITISEFLDRLAADEPTPGGGAVAALVAALAAGLGEMTCAFTLGRPKFAQVEPQVREIATRLARADHMLRKLVDEDAEAYGRLSAAFKLPKDDPQRTGRIAHAAGLAAGVPFQTATLSRQVRGDLRALIELANPRLRSDIDAGLHLAEAAYQAAVANVSINLPFMQADDGRRMQRELDRLNQEA